MLEDMVRELSNQVIQKAHPALGNRDDLLVIVKQLKQYNPEDIVEVLIKSNRSVQKVKVRLAIDLIKREQAFYINHSHQKYQQVP